MKISIYSRAKPASTLKDRRQGTFGFLFGKVEQVAIQYGIKMEKVEDFEGCWKFTADRLLIQMFVEKLHFSRTGYSKTPY